MKKLVTAFAACMIAGLVSAQVSSQNVVGYNTVLLKVGVNAVAPSFDQVSGGSMDLQAVIPGTTAGLKKGGAAGLADNIMIWDLANTKYNLYFLHDGSGKNNLPKANKWVDNATQLVASNVAVSASSGLFYVNNNTSNETVVIAGQVIADTVKISAIPVGVNMIASPYTSEWYLNNDGPDGKTIVDWAASAAKKGGAAGLADNVMIWDLPNTKYNLYFLHDGSGKNNLPKANKWVNNATGLVASNLFIAANEGFFYVNNNTVALSLTNAAPYTLNP